MIEETVSTLRIVGLTEYEARVYLALVTSGSLAAGELSRRSGVPYTRIYDVISKLEEKGWVEKEEGRPAIVFAKAPDMTIGKEMKHIAQQLDHARRNLNSLFTSKPKLERAILLTVNGWTHTNEVLSEMLSTVQSEVMLFFGFFSIQENRTLMEALKLLSRRRVKIMTIARNDPEVVAEVKQLDNFLGVSYVPQAPRFRMTITDWKSALVTFPKVEQRGYNYDDVTSLRLNHPTFLFFMKSIVPILWKEAMPKT